MKGFSGFGNSPVKISDRDVVAAQSQLDKVETKFRQPGWAKAAYKVAQKYKNPMSKDTDLQAKSEGASDATSDATSGVDKKSKSVADYMGTKGDLETTSTGNKYEGTSFDKTKIEGLKLGGY